MAVVRNLLVRAGADFSQMRKSMQQAQKDLERFKTGVSKTMRSIGTVLAATGITLGIRAATKEAMQFEAALQQIDRLMGDSAGSFNKWANEQASAFGMARAEAVRYGAVYANLLSGFSSGTAETMRRTQDLLKASAVVASSTGRTMEDTMERIRSGLLGNTEAIEDLGININVAMLESTKAFRDFSGDRSWQQLDFQTQQTVRYFAILEQAASKYGLELAQNTTSRQAAFTAQLKNAQLALGQAFLPIYNAVLPALTRMATALANAVNYIAQFMQALFGYNTAQQAKSTEAQAGAVSDLGDAYEEAGKQAKGAVAGFDEVNLVGGTTPAAGSGAAGGLVPASADVDTGAYGKVADAMDGVSTKAAEMAAKVKSAFRTMSDFVREHSDIIIAALTGIGAAMAALFVINNAGTIATAFRGIGVAIAGLLNPVGLAVAAIGALTAAFVYLYQKSERFRENVGKVLGATAGLVGLVIGALVDMYRTNEGFRGVVDGVLYQIGHAAKWLWEQVLKPLGAWMQTSLVASWDAVSVAARWLWKNVLVPLGNYFIWIWKNAIIPVANVLRDVLGTAFLFVADVSKSFWENVLVPLGNALREMLAPAVEAVSAVLTFLWENVLKPFATFLGGLIKGVLKDLVDIFKYLWQNVLKPLAEFIGGTLKMVLDNVFTAIGGVIDGVKKAFIGLMNFITGVFTGDWEKAWSGIKDFFGGIWDGIVALFKGAINIIIDAMNWLIRQLNKVNIDLPDWVKDLTGVGDIGINISEIPRLAKGGLAYGPTLAMVGDNRGAAADPEVIAPLSKLEAIMGNGDNREILTVLRSILQAVREDKTVQAVISRSEIGRAAIDTIKDEQRRTGRLPFPV